MVVLHVKRGDESQFLLQAPGSTELEELTAQVARVYNGRLKVHRLCSGTERGAAGSAQGREDLGRFAVARGGEGASGLIRDEIPTTGETQARQPTADSEESSREAKEAELSQDLGPEVRTNWVQRRQDGAERSRDGGSWQG